MFQNELQKCQYSLRWQIILEKNNFKGKKCQKCTPLFLIKDIVYGSHPGPKVYTWSRMTQLTGNTVLTLRTVK